MKKFIILAIVALSPLFIYMSCKNTTEPAADPCKEPVMCTEMFAMVTLQVVAADGSPVKLDEYYTLRVKTREKLIAGNQGMTDSYTVVDDSYVKKLQMQTAEFRFIGIKNGKEIVNEPFTISADCCHVKKESGKTQIILP